MNPSLFLTALIVNIFVGALAYILGAVSRSGMVGGLMVGVSIFYFFRFEGYVILLAFFILGTMVSKWGYNEKAKKGIAQADKGRRGTKHALANCGFPVLLAFATLLVKDHQLLLVAYVAAFATAFSDTVGTELGQLYGKHPILLTTFKPVPVGTEGAVSLEGTVLGVLASVLLALLGLLLRLFPLTGVPFVVIGAFIGTTVESFLGAQSHKIKRLDNELMNFINTVVGGVSAAGLFWVWRKWGG
jgi:uncharacterized protein (TIGR00297 family)